MASKRKRGNADPDEYEIAKTPKRKRSWTEADLAELDRLVQAWVANTRRRMAELPDRGMPKIDTADAPFHPPPEPK